MDRINVLKESKFERMTEAEMAKVNGGLCISCKKRTRTVEIGTSASGSVTCSSSGYTTSGKITTTVTF